MLIIVCARRKSIYYINYDEFVVFFFPPISSRGQIWRDEELPVRKTYVCAS